MRYRRQVVEHCIRRDLEGVLGLVTQFVCRINEAAGRAPVVAHIGEVSTRETRRLGQQIARLGVDAVSAITPWFVPLKQEELINHYTAIADALSVPLFLYNIPARTGNTIAPETARQLARDREPMVQNTSCCSASAEDRNCTSAVRALKAKTRAMPNRTMLSIPDPFIRARA